MHARKCNLALKIPCISHSPLNRYLDIIKSEGLEISQPALDPNSTGIHHRITIRNRMSTFHRYSYVKSL